MVVPPLPDLSELSVGEKVALWHQVVALTGRVEALEQRLNESPKTPDNSSLPPSKRQKADRAEASRSTGLRQGSLGRKGGGRSLMAEPDQLVSARVAGYRHRGTPFGEADHHFHSRYDKIELPPMRPVVTRVERFAGQCSYYRGTTMAPQHSPSFHEFATRLWIAFDRCIAAAKRIMRGRRRTSGMLGMRS